MSNWYAKPFRKGRNSFAKYYDGTEWVKKPIKFYDGSIWTTRNGSPNQLRAQNMLDPTAITALGATKYWNGTSWQVIDALAQESYTITPSTTSVNEGGSVTFNIVATSPGETLYYGVYSYLGDKTVNSYDFGNIPLNGTLTSGLDSIATLTLSISSDGDSELPEYFYIEIHSQYNGSKGDYESQSPIVTINNTSSPTNPTTGNWPVSGQTSDSISYLSGWAIVNTSNNYWGYKSFTYTFPENTPLGHYYMVFWTGEYTYDHATVYNGGPHSSRWIFGLQVTKSFGTTKIPTATALNLTGFVNASNTGYYGKLDRIIITNTTTGEVVDTGHMLAQPNGYATDFNQFAFYDAANTIRVSPGHTISMVIYIGGAITSNIFRYIHNANP